QDHSAALGQSRTSDLEPANISPRQSAARLVKSLALALMRQSSKNELWPDNGCIIDTKWKCGPLSYHSCATQIGTPHTVHNAPMPEVVVYDHVGFKGAYARTNLSFHFLGDFWNDRISCLIIVSGVWRFYRDEYYKGDSWDLGPGFYECFFKDNGPDDVISSFQAISL